MTKSLATPPAPLVVALLFGAIAGLIIALTPIAPPASAAQPRIALLKPRLAETGSGERRALALVIENGGGAGDRLVGARSAQFDEIRLLGPEGAPIDSLAIPARTKRSLGPGGDATLQLGAPRATWTAGAEAEVELRFERSGPVSFTVALAPQPQD